MRNQFFDPGFLFNFYSYRGSTATPFGHSNVRWCGLTKFSDRNGEVQFEAFFSNLIARGTKTRREGVPLFGTVGERRMLYSN